MSEVIEYRRAHEFLCLVTREMTASFVRYDQRLVVVSDIPIHEYYQRWCEAIRWMLDVYGRFEMVKRYVMLAKTMLPVVLHGAKDIVASFQSEGLYIASLGRKVEFEWRETTSDKDVSDVLTSLVHSNMMLWCGGQLSVCQSLYDTKDALFERLLQVSFRYAGVCHSLCHDIMMRDDVTLDDILSAARRVDIRV